MKMSEELTNIGSAVAKQLLSPDELSNLIGQLPSLTTAGTRTVLDHDWGRRIARHPRIQTLVGSTAVPIRAIYFDKRPEVNWTLGWHQDTKIPVREQRDIDGYTNWSTKEGVIHVQPPLEVLEGMVTVRIALDDHHECNGSLLVSPQTHCIGFIPEREIEATIAEHGQRLMTCEAGDAVLMKPLCLHASAKSTSPDSRRTIHIEYATTLPAIPLHWTC